MELLRFFGVLDNFQAAAVPIPPTRMCKGSEILKEVRFTDTVPAPPPDTPYVSWPTFQHAAIELTRLQDTLLVFEQDSTERILRTHLERRFGITVELGMEFLSVDQTEGHVVVRLKRHATGEEESVRAQYLVGTDGGRSAVRKSLGLNFLGSRHDETLMYGDAAIEGLDDQVRTGAQGSHSANPGVQYWYRFGNPPGKMYVALEKLAGEALTGPIG
jgi:2-polyprenyl-6-methoxyphenol hydroxylase-like FAD-dependent oxidoreductase